MNTLNQTNEPGSVKGTEPTGSGTSEALEDWDGVFDALREARLRAKEANETPITLTSSHRREILCRLWAEAEGLD